MRPITGLQRMLQANGSMSPSGLRRAHSLTRYHPDGFKQARSIHQSSRLLESPKAPPPPEDASLPSFNLWHQIRDARPAVRYTVCAGLGLMATVESTFWFNVIKAKFFPSAEADEQAKAEEFLGSIRDAVKGYRKVWMSNYGRYYGAHLWGLGYGGLDGLVEDNE
jgi:hypothetical protein